MSAVSHEYVQVNGHQIFFREAGPLDAPVLLLLHGFPSSSHMFRDLIPKLAVTYRVIAPDLLGFGFSDAPDNTEFEYTFENLTDILEKFTEILGLDKYSLYLFDYGAPVGFRLAMRQPRKISALISQNGNAYTQGLSEAWLPIQNYWLDPSQQNRDALRALLTDETTQWQYNQGTPLGAVIAPESFTLDSARLSRPGNHEIQLDLFLDYASNVDLYSDFQSYFRQYQPPFLAVWGQNDPFFLPAGAEAFKADLKDADIQLFDTGHFALETHVNEISDAIHSFLVSALWQSSADQSW